MYKRQVPTLDIEAGGYGVPDASPDSDETEKNTANAAESPVDAGEEEDGAPRAALMPLDMPSAITGELAMLLPTNQADSIMGSLGLPNTNPVDSSIFKSFIFISRILIPADYQQR